MTPAIFTKLGLRALASYLLLFVSLPAVATVLYKAVQQGNLHIVDVPDAVSYILQIAVAGGVGAVLWLGADRLLAKVLPAGAAHDALEGYPRLQSLVLMFVGGLLALDGIDWLIDALVQKRVESLVQSLTCLLAAVALLGNSVWRPRH
jgi:hypothetical protein